MQPIKTTSPNNNTFPTREIHSTHFFSPILFIVNQSKVRQTPRIGLVKNVTLTTKEKRGIWLLPVRYSRPTTALVVNRQSDTHAVGIYNTPLKVCVMAWLAIGTPTGTVYTYPQHLPLQCLRQPIRLW